MDNIIKLLDPKVSFEGKKNIFKTYSENLNKKYKFIQFKSLIILYIYHRIKYYKL